MSGEAGPLDGVAWRVDQGNVLDVLAGYPDGYFHCAVTSPPYYGLRSYLKKGDPLKPLEIGSEKTPAEYVAKIAEVARAVRRVLRDDGTFWLNVADSYGGSPRGNKSPGGGSLTNSNIGSSVEAARWESAAGVNKARDSGIAPKSLCLVPERLLLALADDGWVVRSKIRWFKVSPMPESVRDRPTSAVEEIFLLAKGPRYFYDCLAERPASTGQEGAAAKFHRANSEKGRYARPGRVLRHECGQTDIPREDTGDRNLWNWWEVDSEGSGSWFVSPEPLPEAHFAAFPSLLPSRCIRLGASEKGCCPECGAPWARVIRRERKPTRPGADSKVYEPDAGLKQDAVGRSTYVGFNARWREAQEVGNRDPQRHVTSTETIGWEAGCECGHADAVPCRVLEPFCGSGRTLLAALRLGRRAAGVELNPEYAALARRLIEADNPLFNRVSEGDR